MADPKPENDKVIEQAAEGAHKIATDAINSLAPPATERIKEITVEGYTFSVDLEKIDDVEVIEMAAQIEEGQVAKIIDFVKFLVGEDGYNNMKAYFVAKDGKFKLTSLMAVFQTIFENFDPKE